MKINIDFLQTGGVPLTNDLMDLVQEAYQLFEVLGDIAGHLTILKGCEIDGSTITPGVVAINGEIYPFEGGLISNTVFIHTEEIEKTFEDQTDKILLEKKEVRFGNALETFNWVDFVRLKTLRELASHIHSWGEIAEKPTEFPPTVHHHDWTEIDNKPTEYPPAEHAHTWDGITGKPLGKIVRAGKIGHNPRRVIRTFVGPFSVTSGGDSAAHKITHNIGHTNYVVIGHALDQGSAMKMNCYKMYSTSCYVATSDDSSTNRSDFQFIIIEF